MATNFEFYKDEILHWFENCGTDCLAGFHGKISGVEFECKAHDECNACGKRLVEFLKQEHIEAPKLTKRERAFCEAVQTGWIARDGDYLYWHIVKPIKDGVAFIFPNSEDSAPMVIKTKGIAFNVIKNKEMMAVEYLLEMEVEA